MLDILKRLVLLLLLVLDLLVLVLVLVLDLLLVLVLEKKYQLVGQKYAQMMFQRPCLRTILTSAHHLSLSRAMSSANMMELVA
jgi:hypothetical protein